MRRPSDKRFPHKRQGHHDSGTNEAIHRGGQRGMEQSGALIESELLDLTGLTLEDVRASHNRYEWHAMEQHLLREFSNPSVFVGDPKS